MRKHKQSLNQLLLNRMNESDLYLSELKFNKENLIITKDILNNTSFRKFWKFLGSEKKDLNSLPLLTRMKIYKELKKINTRSKNSAWIYTLYLTTPLSCFISLALYKTFSNDIRNKKKFFYRYIMKIPFIIMIPSYFFIKNLILVYNIRQPLINLNEVFCEVDCEKEKRNQRMKKMRKKFGKYEKFIKDKKEFEKMINIIKITERENENFKSKTQKSFFPKFYLICYKFLMLKLGYQIIIEMLIARKYFDFLSKCEVNIRISYLNKILLFNHFKRSLHKISKNLFESHTRKLKKVNDNKREDYKIKLILNNYSNTESSLDIFDNILINLRSLHLQKLNNFNIDLLMNMFIFSIISDFLIYDKNHGQINILIKLYEINYHLAFLKKYEIRKILSDLVFYNKIISEDNEAEEFFNYLTCNKVCVGGEKKKIEIKFPAEYFTYDELHQLIREENFLFKSKVNNLWIHCIILPNVASLGLLKYKKYI